VFQDALKEGPNIAQKAVKAIEKMQAGNPGILDSDVSKFLDDAKDLQQFQGSDTRTIAVLGDSGEGKKFLTNPCFSTLTPILPFRKE
jgi:hypothetical protein